MDTILSEGNFYQTWKGKLTQNKSAPLQIVIKKTKGINKYVLLFVWFGHPVKVINNMAHDNEKGSLV